MSRLADMFVRAFGNPARGCPHTLTAETEGGRYCRTCGTPIAEEPKHA